MANSFPPTPTYNGQYGQPPFYPPYMQNTGSSNTGHSTTMPVPPFPPLSANAQRFETNSHVPSPPLPGQLPLNPEVLRHLAASGNLRFPFPPPPPPPPPQLFSSSFPPNQQPLNATAPPGPHQFPPFQPPRPQFETATPPLNLAHKPSPGNSRQIDGAQDRNGNFQANNSLHGVNGLNGSSSQVAHGFDGASFSRIAGAVSNSFTASQNAADPSQVRTAVSSDKAASPTLREELHSKAKSAIRECLTIGADYDFWLQSGVDSSVLDSLFDELDIDKRASVKQAVSRRVDAARKPQSPVQASSSEIKQDAVPSSQTPQPDGLDRKNRIAMLLAAKKGQPLASAKSSQSGSPAPERTTKPEVNPRKHDVMQTQAVSKLENKPNDAEAMSSVDRVDPIEATIVSPSSVSTPGRAQPQHSAFAIPGLFMTSADEVEHEQQQQLARENIGAPIVEPTIVQPSPPKSLKRRAEQLSEDALPQSKRQASYAIKVSAKSEPIVEIASTTGQTHTVFPSSTKMTVNEPERIQDNNVTPTRSMVNQSVLKDRMAALKAQIQMNKARKEALQDGMPMLAAEVEKTRQSLTERHSRLSTIRKDIELKDAELTRLKIEETEVLQEIRRLDSQLLDGENGQRQFSNELTQLDDQIQFNETESANSQTTVTEEARLATATSRPVSAGKPLDPSETAHEQLESPSELVQNEALVVREQSDDALRRSLTTEYNPEQADLDRQLEPEPETVEQDTMVELSDSGSDNVTQSGSADNAPGLEASTGNSAMDEQQSEADSEDDRMSIDEASDTGSSGSASMSDSGSEEYEPALNEAEIQLDAIDDNERDDYEPAEPHEMPVEADNDDYEPAEQVDIIDVDELEESNERLEMPSTESVAAPVISAPSVNGALVEDVTPLSSSPVPPTSTSHTSPIVRSVDQKLTLPQQPAIVDSFPVLVPLSDGEKPSVSRFVPYQSPLANFKSFRFHPQFSDVVKNGFRSLTYSNNIDPKTPICLNELEGRFCDDVNCVDQHFGSMALSDDKILVQMSSANDLKDKDQRDAYLLGLKKVIAGLREQGVREFSEVANALSKYRREWLQGQDGIFA